MLVFEQGDNGKKVKAKGKGYASSRPALFPPLLIFPVCLRHRQAFHFKSEGVSCRKKYEEESNTCT